jgi:hypothetical protein
MVYAGMTGSAAVAVARLQIGCNAGEMDLWSVTGALPDRPWRSQQCRMVARPDPYRTARRPSVIGSSSRIRYPAVIARVRFSPLRLAQMKVR